MSSVSLGENKAASIWFVSRCPGDQVPWAHGYRSPVTSVSHLTSTQPKVSAVLFLIPSSQELILKLVVFSNYFQWSLCFLPLAKFFPVDRRLTKYYDNNIVLI